MNRLVLIAIAFFVGFTPMDSFAAKAKQKRPMVTLTGKITGLMNYRDKRKKRFWKYRLKKNDGKMVWVHDYRYGRYRQPASQGLREGKRHTVRGFFVRISPIQGSSKKEQVLIVQK